MEKIFLVIAASPEHRWFRVEELDGQAVVHSWLGQDLPAGGRRWRRDGEIRAAKALVPLLERAVDVWLSATR